jgi:hypothetical protein
MPAVQAWFDVEFRVLGNDGSELLGNGYRELTGRSKHSLFKTQLLKWVASPRTDRRQASVAVPPHRPDDSRAGRQAQSRRCGASASVVGNDVVRTTGANWPLGRIRKCSDRAKRAA